MRTLFWFRNDLRLDDNPGLSAAIATGKPVLCVYIHDTGNAGRAAPGAASNWWLHYALVDLQKNLHKKGLGLLIAQGRADVILPRIAHEYEIDSLHWNRHYEPWQVERDTGLKAALKQAGHTVETHKGSVLAEPWQARTGAGTPFKVFTPFYKSLLAAGLDSGPASALPARIPAVMPQTILSVDDLGLLPKEPRWDRKLQEHWTIGEDAAHVRLESFLAEAATQYKDGRDIPSIDATSRLSPYLHFGHISPAQIVRRCTLFTEETGVSTAAFVREICWREFSIQLLFHNPGLPFQPLQEKFATFPWQPDHDLLERWQQGKTGYPIVDAGMRQLWETGWMHNRVRMIVASFLVKHLLQPWQDGEAWFWDTLVDADLANNSASWQWVAGCGADAAPYFRVFNPILQGEKFDPQGVYVRRWCPELCALPNASIHKPWTAGQTLDYPPPMLDHAVGRARALTAYAGLQKNT